MAVIPSIINRLYSKRIDQIEYFKNFPVETQQATLQKIVAQAESTEWGEKYSFSSISSIKDYQSRIPVRTYEDYIPFIERMRKGEGNITWPGDIKWFAKSSGTTSSKSKFIPISRESLWDCHYRAAKDTLALYTFNNPETKFFSGKALTLGGSNKINLASNKSIYGDLSAVLIWNAPFYAELIRTPSQKVALIEDFEEKLDRIIKTAVHQNITGFSGVPSWYLTLIKNVLAYTGKSNLLDVWPNLEVFFHGGISFTPYREIYKKLIRGDQMHYMETYNASEGFFGIQDDPSRSDMLLMLDYGIFYEFIPADTLYSGYSNTVTIEEAEKGINYAMVISTNGGLWRYLIGDTIIFTDTNPFRFRISGRTRHFINTFGEEVIVENADQALDVACRKTNSVISDYTAGPVYMSETSRGSHEWMIEFEKTPDDIFIFTDILDSALKSVNSDYEAKRHKDINLMKPVVLSVPKGTFNNWLKSKNKLGGQNKVPRLSNDRKILEELHKFLVK